MNRPIIVAAACLLLTVSALYPFVGPGDAGVGEVGAIDEPSAVAREAPCDLGELLDGVSGGFVENLGQMPNADVRYYAKGDRLTVGMTPTGAVVTLQVEEQAAPHGLPTEMNPVVTATTFTIDFKGCLPVEPQGRGAQGHVSNFFLGNDPDRWVKGAPSYKEVFYNDLWPGVDLRFHLTGGMLKYEFFLATGADNARVALRYDGVDGLEVDPHTGELIISLPGGELRDARPVILQQGVLPIAGMVGEFILADASTVRFSLPAACEPGLPLIIDPGLEFSTLFGGRSTEGMEDIGLDEDGNVYVVGTTMSDDLRVTPGAWNDTLQGLEDIFVAKFDPTLSSLEFATYVGGFSQNDEGMMIRVVQDEGIYICGYTESNDFPTTPGVVAPTHLGGRDIILFELSLDGSDLLRSTFLGGSNLDVAKTIDIDGAGNIYVAGRTMSMDFPTTPGAYDRTFGGGNRGDGYVIKVTKTLDRVLYGTYLGGPGEEYYISMRLGMDGSMYVVGHTQSRFFPVTSGAYCTTFNGGDYDGFVSRLSADGSRLLNSTFIGGNNTEYPWDLRFLDNGSVVILWSTLSPNFPTTDDAISTMLAGPEDIVLTMMDANLTRLQYSTFLGGDGTDTAYRLDWGPDKAELYMSGISSSEDLQCTEGAFDSINRGGYDVIVAGIDMQSLSLSYLSYIGGAKSDYQGYGGLATDEDGRLVVAGYSYSLDFPTTSLANRTSNNGSADAFVLWLDPRPCGAPDAPTELGASPGNGYVDLSWTVPFNESYRLLGHRLYRGTSPDNVSERVELDLNGGYNDTYVTNGVTYYYQVVTVSSAGESARTPIVSARPLGPSSAPNALTVTTGDGTVNLTWERPTQLGGDLVGYHVLRGMSSRDLGLLATIGPSEVFVDTDVVLGETYFYAVRAYNDLFNGTTSLVVRIKAQGPPSSPQGLMAVAGNQSVLLDWSTPLEDGGSTILAYYVYTSPTGDNWTFHASVLPTMLRYEDRGLENGRTYNYRVSAVSNVGESPASETVSATPIGTPGVPRDFVAEGIDGGIRLTWAAPQLDGGTPATGYRVYGGDRVDTLALLIATDADALGFLHSPVTNGETRYYQISTVNTEGEGERSHIMQATAMGLPSAPRNLTATLSNGTIRLTWGPPEDFGGSPRLVYRVMRGTSSGSLSLLTEVSGALELVDVDVHKGNTYFYQIAAVNLRGNPGATSTILRQEMIGAPGTPVNLTASARDRAVSLTWGPPPPDPDAPVDAYAVLRGTTPTDLEEIARVRVSLYDDRDPALDNGVTYYYAIVAINGIGQGPPTATVSSKPMPPPGMPSLRASVKNGDVVLKWDPPTGEAAPVTGYVLYRGKDPNNLQVIAELGLVTNHTDSYLGPGQTYHYAVLATSLSGEGPRSETVRVELPENVGEATWVLPSLVALIIVFALLAGVVMKFGRRSRPGTGSG